MLFIAFVLGAVVSVHSFLLWGRHIHSYPMFTKQGLPYLPGQVARRHLGVVLGLIASITIILVCIGVGVAVGLGVMFLIQASPWAPSSSATVWISGIVGYLAVLAGLMGWRFWLESLSESTLHHLVVREHMLSLAPDEQRALLTTGDEVGA